ncbi:MAG: hypothetical protein ACHQPI_02530 [Thermoanaerobaculia bacterium]
MKRDPGAINVLLLSACLAASSVLEAQVPGGNVLPMTPENLDRLAKGLGAEEAARKGIAERAARTKSPAEYRDCKNAFLRGPDAAKVMQDSTAELKKHSNDATANQKVFADMKTKLDELTEKKCGPDPSSSRSGPSSQSREIAEAAAKEVGLTPRQYAILKERVAPLCALGEVPVGPEGARLHGSGNVFWVYSAGEVAALRPRCAALMKALRVEKH